MYEKPKKRWHVEVEGQIDFALSSVNRSQAELKAGKLQREGVPAKVVRR